MYLSADFSVLGKTIFDDGYIEIYDADSNRYIKEFFNAGTILIDTHLLNKSIRYPELRMTGAHELAHWTLHRRHFSEGAVHSDLYKQQLEEEADRFARAILLPSATTKCLCEQYTKVGYSEQIVIHKIAHDMKVLPEDVKKRLREIGRLGNAHNTGKEDH